MTRIREMTTSIMRSIPVIGNNYVISLEDFDLVKITVFSDH